MGETQFAEKANSSIAEAIKHAEMAKTLSGDAKEIQKHAEMSLEYARKAEIEAIDKVNSQGVEHITASITHLQKAIEHAKMEHADVASKHVDEALNEMHQALAKNSHLPGRAMHG